MILVYLCYISLENWNFEKFSSWNNFHPLFETNSTGFGKFRKKTFASGAILMGPESSKHVCRFKYFIFRVMVIFILKTPQFSMNFYDNSKNKNRKMDSYILSHSASFMKTGSKLMGMGRGGRHVLSWEK